LQGKELFSDDMLRYVRYFKSKVGLFHNRTHGVMEKPQQELKRTRLENRKFKNLASFAMQYDQHCNALISEYYDGFRKTFFKRKVRPSPCLQGTDATFPQHTDIPVENGKEKWCERKRLHGQDKTIGVYLQKSKFPLHFKSSKRITSHGSDQGRSQDFYKGGGGSYGRKSLEKEKLLVIRIVKEST